MRLSVFTLLFNFLLLIFFSCNHTDQPVEKQPKPKVSLKEKIKIIISEVPIYLVENSGYKLVDFSVTTPSGQANGKIYLELDGVRKDTYDYKYNGRYNHQKYQVELSSDKAYNSFKLIAEMDDGQKVEKEVPIIYVEPGTSIAYAFYRTEYPRPVTMMQRVCYPNPKGISVPPGADYYIRSDFSITDEIKGNTFYRNLKMENLNFINRENGTEYTFEEPVFVNYEAINYLAIKPQSKNYNASELSEKPGNPSHRGVELGITAENNDRPDYWVQGEIHGAYVKGVFNQKNELDTTFYKEIILPKWFQIGLDCSARGLH